MTMKKYLFTGLLVWFWSCENVEYQDCHGTVSGGAYFDECGDCVGGRTGLIECGEDCEGNLGGVAFINLCDICVGGETGIQVDSCESFDYHGYRYRTVIIGDQVWVKEDLNTINYRSGNTISVFQTTSDSIGTFSQNTISNGNEKNGVFYNWHVAISDSIAPDGWRVPNKEDFQELINGLGGEYLAGGKLKKSGFTAWDFPNNYATNESGFSAIGKGYRDQSGIFQEVGRKCSFWSLDTVQNDDTTTTNYFWVLKLSFDSNYTNVIPDSDNYGHLIRLIKN